MALSDAEALKMDRSAAADVLCGCAFCILTTVQTDGFEEAELLYTKYDPYAMQDEWTAKNGTFPGYNCRITAMNLFGDFLSVSADSQINAGEDVLFVDEETLKTDPDALGGSSLADFRALYSSMKAEDTTEIKRHVQTVQEEWASRGVTFRENERIRLITVFFHDKPTEEESLLFVGHVGVLLTAEDGTLYFVEKVAFQEPYRLLRFADRTALSDYLMGKYDTSWDKLLQKQSALILQYHYLVP